MFFDKLHHMQYVKSVRSEKKIAYYKMLSSLPFSRTCKIIYFLIVIACNRFRFITRTYAFHLRSHVHNRRIKLRKDKF